MNKKNKTLHVITRYFFPVVTGLEVNLFETYSNLVKEGWKVIVYTTRDSYTQTNVFKSLEKIRGITIKRFKSKDLKWEVLNKKTYSEESIVCLHDIDITNHTLFLIKVMILKLLKKKKNLIIFTSHGLFNYSSNIYPGIKMKIRKLIEHFLIVPLINCCVDGVRCVSQLEAKGLLKAGIKKKIAIIGNGIQEEAFLKSEKNVSATIKKLVKNNSPYILTLGRIDRVKNYETAITAMKNINKRIKLLIVGPDQDLQYKNNLLKLVLSLDLTKRVIFTGPIYGENKYYLMRNAKLLIHMSQSEAFGNAIHEALSQGTVCIVSKNTAENGLVKNEKNGFVVDTFNSFALSQKIEFLIKNLFSEKVKKIKRMNIEQTRLQTWKNVALRVEGFYLSLIKI